MQITTRRRLPHIHAIGRPLFITFRLHGSLPQGRHFTNHSISSGDVFVHLDRLLNRCTHGPLYLRMPEITQVIEDAIKQGNGKDYSLHAWVIMPNHVHMFATPLIEPAVYMQRLKGATAREANLLLNRTGSPFWQHESYDRTARNATEFKKIENYILQNPVNAGLASSAEHYRWSSAWHLRS